ncbi:Phosphatidate cytidylyltransferase [Prosthecochloris sp. CIB 2401]|nr:Phosphatidate cytidylyltransferase [Prosthecochloris sp. CIB 2401]
MGMNLKQPSNLTQRVLVAIVGVPLLLWLTWQGGLYFLGLVLVLALVGTNEFHHLIRQKAYVPSVFFFLLFTLLFQLNFHYQQVDSWVLFLLLFMVLLVRELFRAEGSRILNIGAAMTGLLYVNVTFGALLRIRMHEPLGMHLVYLLLVSVWAADIAAYFGGRKLGGRFFRQKFFERISPHKTWEGYLSGILGALLGGGVFAMLDPSLGYVPALMVAGAIGVVSPVGDLVESMFKRDAGVKDSSGLIPGHGGVLDRFDTVMFVSPLIYVLTLFL